MRSNTRNQDKNSENESKFEVEQFCHGDDDHNDLIPYIYIQPIGRMMAHAFYTKLWHTNTSINFPVSIYPSLNFDFLSFRRVDSEIKVGEKFFQQSAVINYLKICLLFYQRLDEIYKYLSWNSYFGYLILSFKFQFDIVLG